MCGAIAWICRCEALAMHPNRVASTQVVAVCYAIIGCIIEVWGRLVMDFTVLLWLVQMAVETISWISVGRSLVELLVEVFP